MQTAKYAVAELAFRGPEGPDVGLTPLTVTFRHIEGAEVRVQGFWDGGDRYLARFCPELEGRWQWRTESAVASLDALSGEVDVAGSVGHGPVRVAAQYHFAHADGTPFRPVGATVYNWLHQDQELFDATVTAITTAGFNKLRFMVFPQAGNHIVHEPELFPFERDADGWDVGRPEVGFFQRLDRAVSLLLEVGLQADVLVLNAYDSGHFGLDELTPEQDSAYASYLMARLSAYPNIWWSMCNEFDIMGRPAERWNALGQQFAKEDPHQHLRSIHNWIEYFDHNQPWITHASIQNGFATMEFGRAFMYRDAYLKPVVLDEIKYEGDIEARWGHLSAEELVHQFWISTVSGCYASHGESFLLPNGSLHIVEGGPLLGESPARLGFLRQVLDDLMVPGLDPIDPWDDLEYVAGVPRQQYLRYFGMNGPASWTFRLPQGHRGERLQVGDRFRVDVIDTWDMTVTLLEQEFTLTDVQRNDAWAGADVPLPEGRPTAVLITRLT